MKRRFDTCGEHSHPCVKETIEDTGEVLHHDSQEQKDSPIRLSVGRRFDYRLLAVSVAASLLLEALIHKVF